MEKLTFLPNGQWELYKNDDKKSYSGLDSMANMAINSDAKTQKLFADEDKRIATLTPQQKLDEWSQHNTPVGDTDHISYLNDFISDEPGGDHVTDWGWDNNLASINRDGQKRVVSTEHALIDKDGNPTHNALYVHNPNTGDAYLHSIVNSEGKELNSNDSSFKAIKPLFDKHTSRLQKEKRYFFYQPSYQDNKLRAPALFDHPSVKQSKNNL